MLDVLHMGIPKETLDLFETLSSMHQHVEQGKTATARRMLRAFEVRIRGLDSLDTGPYSQIVSALEQVLTPKAKTADLCSVCGESQFSTPSGIVCRNGHGGAPPLRR